MRDLFQSNFALKILSLILATLLWFAIESNLSHNARLSATPFGEEATLDLTCPVAVLEPPAAERTYLITPAEVAVKLAGSPSVLSELDVPNVAVFIRIPANLKTEESLAPEVKLPPSVRLIEMNPAQVSVKPKVKAPE